MARAFGKILSRTWDDEDFLALEVSPQRLYHFLVSQANLSHAGLLPLTLRKWSKKAKGLTIAELEKDLTVLDEARFIVLDEDSEELLIRTYIRNDDVYKMPRVMGAAVSDAQEIESLRLRRALLAEIDRLPLDELSEEPTKGRNGRPGPSIRTQIDDHIRALRVAFGGVRPVAGTPSAAPSGTPSPTPFGEGFDSLPQPPAEGVAEPPAEPLPEGVAEGVGEGVQEGVHEPLPEGVAEGGAEGVYARAHGPAHPRTSPTPAPTPTPSPTPAPPPTNPPPSPPLDGAASEAHQSGTVGGEEINSSHDTATAIIEGLPPEARPSRGAADSLIAAVAELVRLGWPAEELRHRMCAELPGEIRNPAAFLMQRLPSVVPYRPPAGRSAPHVLTTGRQMCQVHRYVELTGAGTCPSCAGDAKAATSDDDLDQRPPVGTRSLLPPYEDIASPDSESESARNYARARQVIDVLDDREQWLNAAREHLADLGEDFPGAVRTTVTAAQLYQAAQQPDPPPAPEEE